VGRVFGLFEKVSRVSVWIGGAMVLFMAFYICVDVLFRKIFNISVRGGDEFSGYVLAIIGGWSFAYALFKKNHVRIDVLYLKLPLKARSFLDILSLLALIGFVLPLTYYSFGVLHKSIVRGSLANTPLQTPLWIPQSLWFAGLLFFSMTLVLFLMGTVYNILKGDLISAYKIAGSSSLKEEVKEEVEAGIS